MRVLYTTDASYDDQPVTGRLDLGPGTNAIDVAETLVAASDDADLATTIDFEISGAAIAESFQYHVSIGRVPGQSGGMGETCLVPRRWLRRSARRVE